MWKNPINKIHFSAMILSLLIFIIDFLGMLIVESLQCSKWKILIILIFFIILLMISILNTYKKKKLILVASDVILLDIIYIIVRMLFNLGKPFFELLFFLIGTYLFICVNIIDESTISNKYKWYKPAVQYIFFPFCVIATIWTFC